MPEVYFILFFSERKTSKARLFNRQCRWIPLFCGGTGGRNPGERVREKRTGSGIPRWREAGEIRENHSTLRNILQSKNGNEAGANKKDVGTGIQEYGKREVRRPSPPPSQSPPFFASRERSSGASLFCPCRRSGRYIRKLLLISGTYNISRWSQRREGWIISSSETVCRLVPVRKDADHSKTAWHEQKRVMILVRFSHLVMTFYSLLTLYYKLENANGKTNWVVYKRHLIKFNIIAKKWNKAIN